MGPEIRSSPPRHPGCSPGEKALKGHSYDLMTQGARASDAEASPQATCAVTAGWPSASIERRRIKQEGNAMLTRRGALGALFAGGISFPAFAQGRYPDQPVKLIIPFPAGGPTDIVGRLLARVFQERLGSAFVVDNRGGAGGTIGLTALAQSKPDGYTLAVSATGALAMLPHMMPKMPFDAEGDFQP